MESQLIIKSVDDVLLSLKNTPGMGDNKFGFRGQINHTWKAMPSLFRQSRNEAMLLQRSLFRKFLMNSKQFPSLTSNDPVELLMIFQHFGIPTRLLDISRDPLVALFFACYDPRGEFLDEDGKFFIYPVYQYENLKIEDPDLEVYKEPITSEKIKERVFDRITVSKHLFLEPLIKNARMRAQNGCFIYFSSFWDPSQKSKLLTLEDFHRLCNAHTRSAYEGEEQQNRLLWYACSIVDKTSKKKILVELEQQYGISASSLFPETAYLDSVSDFYINHYQDSIEYLKILKKKVEIPDQTFLLY